MIVNQTSDMVNTSGMQSTAFGIEGSALVYRLMYSTMYNEKEKVVLQELVANAGDAHSSAGKHDVPVRVVLPSDMSPELVIEDEGIGMSFETVNNVYPVYGRSLKSDSNDNIGGFGYGGKSPFAISESYTVETTHKGVTTTVACYLDNAFPKFSVFQTGNVGKPDGTVIRVPVADKDKQRLLKEHASTLFQLWKVKPTFSGHQIDQSDNLLQETDHLLIFKAESGLYPYKYGRKQSDSIYKIAVGPFIYAIPSGMLSKLEAHDTYNTLSWYSCHPVGYDVVFRFNIGEIELSPSREWVEDTPANIATILAAATSEVRTLKGTQTPVGVSWYEEITNLVKSQGIWLHDLVPSTTFRSVPLIVDVQVLKDKLVELRGTKTNLLTANYDQSAWEKVVVPEINKNYQTAEKYCYGETVAPPYSSALLSDFRVEKPNFNANTMSWSERWTTFSRYTNVFTSTENLYQEALSSLLGVASTDVRIRAVDNGKIRVSRYSDPDTNRRIETYRIKGMSKILLYTEATGARTGAWLRAQANGTYMVVAATDEVIKNIADFCTKYKNELDSDILSKFVFASEVDTAYAAYRQDLKANRKVVTTPRVKTADVVVGTIYSDYDAVTPKFAALTRGELEAFNFSDTTKKYVICTTEAVDFEFVLDTTTREKYRGCMSSLTIITLQAQKTKTQWYRTFLTKLENDHPEVTVTSYANVYSSSSPIRKALSSIPEVEKRTQIFSNWDVLATVFNKFGHAFTALKLLHPNGFSEDFIRAHTSYQYYETPKSKVLLAAIMANHDAKSAYAKISVAISLKDTSFVSLITADEKQAYLDVVASQLTLE